MAIKYIMTKDKGIVMFSGILGHDEVAQKFGGATSAGFINIKGEDTRCYGESISLHMKADEKDSDRAISQLIYN